MGGQGGKGREEEAGVVLLLFFSEGVVLDGGRELIGRGRRPSLGSSCRKRSRQETGVTRCEGKAWPSWGSRDPQEPPVARWRRRRRRGINAAATLPLVLMTPFRGKQPPLPPSLVKRSTDSTSQRPGSDSGGGARSLYRAASAQTQSITANTAE